MNANLQQGHAGHAPPRRPPAPRLPPPCRPPPRPQTLEHPASGRNRLHAGYSWAQTAPKPQPAEQASHQAPPPRPPSRPLRPAQPNRPTRPHKAQGRSRTPSSHAQSRRPPPRAEGRYRSRRASPCCGACADRLTRPCPTGQASRPAGRPTRPLRRPYPQRPHGRQHLPVAILLVHKVLGPLRRLRRPLAAARPPLGRRPTLLGPDAVVVPRREAAREGAVEPAPALLVGHLLFVLRHELGLLFRVGRPHPPVLELGWRVLLIRDVRSEKLVRVGFGLALLDLLGVARRADRPHRPGGDEAHHARTDTWRHAAGSVCARPWCCRRSRLRGRRVVLFLFLNYFQPSCVLCIHLRVASIFKSWLLAHVEAPCMRNGSGRISAPSPSPRVARAS
eukprot:scaffold12572_cov108-Isochrysis_galbana.AAC.2